MPSKIKKLFKKEDIVKSLKGFVQDEDGFVSKETILRVGLSTVAGMAALGAMNVAMGRDHSTDHTNHSNSIGVPGGTCCFQHMNTVSHGSY